MAHIARRKNKDGTSSWVSQVRANGFLAKRAASRPKLEAELWSSQTEARAHKRILRCQQDDARRVDRRSQTRSVSSSSDSRQATLEELCPSRYGVSCYFQIPLKFYNAPQASACCVSLFGICDFRLGGSPSACLFPASRCRVLAKQSGTDRSSCNLGHCQCIPAGVHPRSLVLAECLGPRWPKGFIDHPCRSHLHNGPDSLPDVSCCRCVRRCASRHGWTVCAR